MKNGWERFCGLMKHNLREAVFTRHRKILTCMRTKVTIYQMSMSNMECHLDVWKDHFVFECSVTGQAYLHRLRISILHVIPELYGNEVFLQDSVPTLNRQDVRVYLNENLKGHWRVRKSAVHFACPHSLDFAPPDIYLWTNLKDAVYLRKTTTLVVLGQDIENVIPLDTLSNVVQEVVRSTNKRFESKGQNFQHFWGIAESKGKVY